MDQATEGERVMEVGHNPDRLLTPDQAAEALQVSKRTMYEWLRTGQVPGILMGPKLWRVREGDILTPGVRGLLEQGLICDANCRVQEGAVFFRKALELNPRYNLANLCLGNMYYRWSHYHKAEAPLKTAIELNPEWIAPYGILGLTYNHCWNFAGAEEMFRKAIELSPDHAESHYQLGYALLQQHTDEKQRNAVGVLQRAIDLDPRHAMAHYFLVELLIKGSDFYYARKVYEGLRGIDGKEAESLLKKIEFGEQQFLQRRRW
jgi:excisionase family DNA binding protein